MVGLKSIIMNIYALMKLKHALKMVCVVLCLCGLFHCIFHICCILHSINKLKKLSRSKHRLHVFVFMKHPELFHGHLL